MSSLSPKRRARHAWDTTRFPSDVEASCSSACSCCSSPSPEYLGLSLSPSFSSTDYLRRRNAGCTTKDGYADDERELGYWARLHPEHFTEIDPPSIHAVEGGQSGPHEYMIGYPSPTDEACCEKGIYFTFVMDTATDVSNIATISRASSSCIGTESSGSFGQDGYKHNADRPAASQTFRNRRLSRPSASQRYSPIASTRRTKVSKILDWVADVENVRPKPFGFQNGVIDRSRLLDSDEVLYSVEQGSDSSSSLTSPPRSLQSSIRETEEPTFAISSPCPTEIILSTSPYSQMSGHGLDWDGMVGSYERPRASEYRHMAAYTPPFSSKLSSPYEVVVTGPSPLAADDTVANSVLDRVNDKHSDELALRFHRMGRMSNEKGSIEVEEDVCFTQEGYMQTTTTTIHHHARSSPSHHSSSSFPSNYCNCTGGSCSGTSYDASGSGRWSPKGGFKSHQRSVRGDFIDNALSPASVHSYPASSGGQSYHEDAYYDHYAQPSSSGSHYSSYPPSTHEYGASSAPTSSDFQHRTSSHSWNTYSQPSQRFSSGTPSQSPTATIPLYQPQPVRPILAISISELAEAEEASGTGCAQTPLKMKRSRRKQPMRRDDDAEAVSKIDTTTSTNGEYQTWNESSSRW